MKYILIFACICIFTQLASAIENIYLASGIPAADREWIGNEYKTTFEILQKGGVPLPAFENPYGSRLLSRMTDESNFSFYRNRSLSLDLRIADYLDFQEYLNSLTKLYLLKAIEGKNVHREIAELLAFSLSVASVSMDLLNEYIPTVPHDEKYAIRMDGVKGIFSGLRTVFVNAGESAFQDKIYIASDRNIIIKSMQQNLQKLLQAFSEDFRIEMRVKFEARLNQFTGTDKKLLESMINTLKSEREN